MNFTGIIIGVVLVALLGGGYVINNRQNEAEMTATMEMEKKTAEMEKAAMMEMEAKEAMMQEEMKKDEAMMEDKGEMEDGAMMKKDEAMVKSDASMQKTVAGDEVMMKKDEAMMKEDVMSDEAMMKHGSYEAYAPAKLAKANTGKVVLFFRASWCPSCKTLDANITKNAMAIPEGLTILDVNYDDSTELKKKYGVTYQHTLVQVDASGNQIAKWSGSPTLADIVTKAK
jgi:thiol-disulfide isomerase/thioredoxin